MNDLVPVKVRGSVIVRADEDADIDRAFKCWTRAKEYRKADIEEDPGKNFKILRIGNEDATVLPGDYESNEELLEVAASEAFHAGKGITIHDATVIDSK